MDLTCLSIKLSALYFLKYEILLKYFLFIFIILIAQVSKNNFWKYQFKMYRIKKNWTEREINSQSDLIPNILPDTYPQNIQVVKSFYFVIFIFKK